MGEQINKEEPTQEEKVEEEKIKSEPPPPPPPFVLYIDLHCVGCAKKMEKILTKMRGIEGVVIDMAQNQVTLKGIVEPQAICDKIMKKTKRKAKVISPLPTSEDELVPQVISSQATEPTTVKLDVNMHCEACANQLKKMILKIKGVQDVETELKSSKVTVTGTMDPENIVEYVYQRTKKQAKIVPQSQPEPEPTPAVEDKKEAKAKDEKQSNNQSEKANTEDKMADEEIISNERDEQYYQMMSMEEEYMKRMHYFYASHQPLYVVESLPMAPQMFSDENPNACSIC